MSSITYNSNNNGILLSLSVSTLSGSLSCNFLVVSASQLSKLRNQRFPTNECQILQLF